jgi:hypothetical protein
VNIYNKIINPIKRRNGRGSGLNPNIPARGVYGRINVMTTIDKVANKRYLPGLLK